MENTSKDNIPGAIDSEPNDSVYVVRNIMILNNTIKNCRGTAGGICVNTNSKGGKVHRVTIRENRISSSSSEIAIVVMGKGNYSWFVIEKNKISYDTKPYRFVGEGESKDWIFRDNEFYSPFAVRYGGKNKS